MKKLISIILVFVCLLSLVGAVSPVFADASEIAFVLNAAEKCKSTFGKNTASLETVEEDGIKALKVTPNNVNPEHGEIIMDFYNLGLTGKDLENVRYIAVKYRYECPPSQRGAGDSMGILMMPSGGGLKSWVNLNAITPTVANNWWGVSIFDVRLFESHVDSASGKTFSQFHFYPFGKNIDPKSIPDGESMFIGDIEFWTGYPEVYKTDIEKANAVFEEYKAEIAAKEAEKAAKKYENIDMNETPLFVLDSTLKNKGTFGVNTVKIDKVSDEEKNAIKLTPNNVDPGSAEIVLDYHSLGIAGTDLQFVRYIAVNYKYVCPSEKRGAGQNMSLLMMPAAGALKGWVNINSLNLIKEDKWEKIIFDVNLFKTNVNTGNGAYLQQFHLYPYGKGVDPKALSPEDVMLIGNIEFWGAYPGGVGYAVSYDCKIPEAVGEDPESFTAKRGTKFTLPDNPYTFLDKEFLGWRSSYDNELYAPGEELSVNDGNIYLNAEFAYAEDGAPDFKALNYTEYQNGMMNNSKSATVENVVFDSKDAVKVTVNREFDNKSSEIVLDGWSYAPAEIDLKDYKYLAITYYCEGELPEGKEPKFRIGISTLNNVLTNYFSSDSHQPIKTGSWQIATFNMDATRLLNPNLEDHFIRQIHMRPFGSLKIGEFENEVSIYINQIMFFADDPALEMHESYIKGYDGGIFKPGNTMTRAEACTIIARLSAGGDESIPADLTVDFSDVSSDEWYYKYIAYVRNLGFLSSYPAGEFYPNKAITRAEFVELVFKMGMLKDNGYGSVFTDVSSNHSKYDVITASAKAGLINGYDNGDGTFSFKPNNTISRAEVVKVINNAFSRSVTKDNLSSDIKFLFYDVPVDFWAFPEICEASLPHIESNGEWICSMLAPKALLGGNDRVDLEAGAAYLVELEKKTSARIEEIKNMPTTVEVSGKKYYVSNSTGNDSNDGLSPETAWKTLSKASRSGSLLKSGDGVFLKRGDLWRESLVCFEGVTYSAYGTGDKPRIYGSPENGADASKWSLLEGTSNIWVYNKEMIDIGLIVLDADTDNTLWTDKEVPDLRNGKFYDRGSNYGKEFNIIASLDKNRDFFSEVRSFDNRVHTGKLYLRCDEGNPGDVYRSIEFNPTNHIVRVNGDNVLIDNLCIKYGGAHGIASGSRNNLKVQNCEIGWIGGGIQYYGGVGGVVLFGNGVEIYGQAQDYLIDNCYVYQCYDAGVTHQFSGDDGNCTMKNITYSNNVIVDCIYSIEYFNSDSADGNAIRDGENVLVTGNILRRAGYGFGITRPNGNSGTHMRGNGRNEYKPGTFIVENNIFDRSSFVLLNTTAYHDSWLPVYRNNTYIQILDGVLGFYTGERIFYDCVADYSIKLEFGDENATVYFVSDEYAMKNY